MALGALQLLWRAWPIWLWIIIRYAAVDVAPEGLSYNAVTTAGPLALLAAVAALRGADLASTSTLRITGLGVLASGFYGIYLEYARWQGFGGPSVFGWWPFLVNLDWQLIVSTFLCLSASTFALGGPRLCDITTGRHRVKSHGSARWMRLAEARRVFSSGRLVIGEAYNPRRTPRKGGVRPLLRFDGSGHLLTVAGSGSGKTVSVAIPNVLNWEDGLVVHDPKAELSRLCQDFRERKGRQVIVLDPSRPDTASINVLDWLKQDDESVIENAQAVVSWLRSNDTGGDDKNRYFDNEGGKLVLTCLLHALFTDDLPDHSRTLRTVRRYLTDGVTLTLAKIAKKGDNYAFGVAPQYARELLAVADNAEAQWSGILGVASEMTGWLSQPGLARIVCGSEGHPPSARTSDLLDGRTDVFLNVPLKTLDATPAPSRLLLGALLNVKYERAHGQAAGDRRVLFLLDEMPRLRRMPILETARDAGRGAGIVLWSIIQDLGQLERYYEKSGRQSWMENAQVKTFFGISDYDTADLLSRMMDEQTLHTRSTSRSRSGTGKLTDVLPSTSDSTSDSTQAVGRRLMTPGEIMSMAVDENGVPDEQLVFVRGRPPLRCGMAKWYRRPEWKTEIAT